MLNSTGKDYYNKEQTTINHSGSKPFYTSSLSEEQKTDLRKTVTEDKQKLIDKISSNDPKRFFRDFPQLILILEDQFEWNSDALYLSDFGILIGVSNVIRNTINL